MALLVFVLYSNALNLLSTLQKPFRVSAAGSNQPSGAAILDKCSDKFYVPQLVMRTAKGYIMADESVCLDSPSGHEKDATVRFQGRKEHYFLLAMSVVK